MNGERDLLRGNGDLVRSSLLGENRRTGGDLVLAVSGNKSSLSRPRTSGLRERLRNPAGERLRGL